VRRRQERVENLQPQVLFGVSLARNHGRLRSNGPV
jgi:hypothetical protein